MIITIKIKPVHMFCMTGSVTDTWFCWWPVLEIWMLCTCSYEIQEEFKMSELEVLAQTMAPAILPPVDMLWQPLHHNFHNIMMVEMKSLNGKFLYEIWSNGWFCQWDGIYLLVVMLKAIKKGDMFILLGSRIIWARKISGLLIDWHILSNIFYSYQEVTFWFMDLELFYVCRLDLI